MKILNKLTIKHLKMNKKRTIVTIIGIILSTALMVGIGLLFSSLRDNTIKTTMAKTGQQHLIINDIFGSKKNLLENNVEVETVDYLKKLGYASLEGSINQYKPYLEVVSASEKLLKQFTLEEGRLPKNDTEIVISAHIKSNGGVNYNIGDTLTLSLGKRMLDGKELLPNIELSKGEGLSQDETKTYKIVGVVERTFVEDYSSPGYMIFSKLDGVKENDTVSAFLTYKNVKGSYKKGDALGKSLGFSNSEIADSFDYNDALLSTYGVSRYSNIMDSMLGLIIIVLVLISIGCIIVIYNSFAISVMERKKQFGLFSSIGSTKKQLRHTVFFEALIVGGIGIPLGVLSAIAGIGIVLMIVNSMLPNVFEFALALSIYPTFIIVPILFMIAVILLSAFLPARQASRITPIEAIRQNDDIKIKGKKLKTNKWMRKIFGMEGEIALKNIKRNKKKYRITVVSLFISIVLFISFSSLMYYGIYATNDMVENPSYDFVINIHSKKESETKDFYHKIENMDEVKQSVYTTSLNVSAEGLEKAYSKDAKKAREKVQSGYIDENGKQIVTYDVNLICLNEDAYKTYLKDLKLTKEVPIVLNRTKSVDYTDGKRKVKTFDIFAEKVDSISLYQMETDTPDDENAVYKKKNFYELKELYYTDKEPFGLKNASTAEAPVIIVNDEMYNEIKKGMTYEDVFATILIKAPKYQELEKLLKDTEQQNIFDTFYSVNIAEEMQLQKNVIFVLNLLLYGFISLVTLIGVTSVFNTIGTSIALRRKEFAMLRSMGLTPRGFNKILYFESLFFGLKSLLYAIPVSLLVTYFINVQIGNMVTAGFMIPWMSILIAVVGVFIIVFISMMYASAKIKKENILDAIREENI